MHKKSILGNFRGDISGALISAIITLPMSMGYGILAFTALGVEFAPMAAIYGIHAAIYAGFFASFLGGSPIQITGPMIPITLVLSTFVSGLVSTPIIESSPAIIFGLASLCVLIAGFFQVLFGLLRLSNLVKFVPQPVISGFINGIALLVIVKQIRPILGMGSNTPLFDIFRQAVIINPLTLVTGIITIGSFYISNRFVKSIPPILSSIIVGTLSYYLLISFFPNTLYGQTIGTLQIHLNPPDVLLILSNHVDKAIMKSIFLQLLATSLVISLIGSMESLLSAVATDNFSKSRHNSKKEIIGQGIGNIASSIFGAIPSGGSIIRSTANFKAGGRTRLSGMLCSVFILLIILIFGSYAGQIPIAVIAAIILVVGLNMFDKWTLSVVKNFLISLSCPKETRVDLFINLFVVVITISINLVAAVGIGMIVASALFISKIGRSVIKRHYFADHFHSRKMRPVEHINLLEKKGRQISMIQLQGPIFFGSAEHLDEKIQNTLQHSDYIIIDFKHVSEIDSTGASILLRLEQNIAQEKKQLLFANLQNNNLAWSFMKVMNFTAKLKNENLFLDTDSALEWSEDCLLKKYSIKYDISPEYDLDQMILFNNFTSKELEIIKEKLILKAYSKGDMVFSENDKSRDLYILVKGLMTVIIYLPERRRHKRLFTYAPGVIFGEMSFLDGNPRSAGVKTYEESKIFCLLYTDYELMCKENPEVANKLLKNIALEISIRLRRTSNQLRGMEDN